MKFFLINDDFYLTTNIQRFNFWVFFSSRVFAKELQNRVIKLDGYLEIQSKINDQKNNDDKLISSNSYSGNTNKIENILNDEIIL